MGEEGLHVARSLLDDKKTGGFMTRAASGRLAFREFGTCMGLKCYGITGDEDLERKVEAVLRFWERCLDGSTEDDLRPISLVMFAAALIPGGEFSLDHAPTYLPTRYLTMYQLYATVISLANTLLKLWFDAQISIS